MRVVVLMMGRSREVWSNVPGNRKGNFHTSSCTEAEAQESPV